MFVCPLCHKKVCSKEHLVMSFGACDVCNRQAERYDCVPITRAAEGAPEQVGKRWDITMYRNVRNIEYPRQP